MKKHLSLIILLFLFSSGFSQTAALQIRISGIKADSGFLRIGLFNDAEDYKTKSNPIVEKSTGITDAAVNVTFHHLPADTYAVAIYHDANNDKELNKRKLGIPEEGVGFSGISQSGIRPPAFSEAGFAFSTDTILHISMRYPKKK